MNFDGGGGGGVRTDVSASFAGPTLWPPPLSKLMVVFYGFSKKNGVHSGGCSLFTMVQMVDCKLTRGYFMYIACEDINFIIRTFTCDKEYFNN